MTFFSWECIDCVDAALTCLPDSGGVSAFQVRCNNKLIAVVGVITNNMFHIRKISFFFPIFRIIFVKDTNSKLTVVNAVKKFIFLPFVFLIFSTSHLFTQQSQLSRITRLSSSDSSINNNEKDNFEHFPFRFGFEFAGGTGLTDPPMFAPGLFAFMDLDIAGKVLFLKLEYGSFYMRELTNTTATYASFGINYKVYSGKSNNFFVHIAVAGMGNNTGGGASAFFAVRYLHSFNKYLGLISSFRYPFGGFKSLLLTIGLQFPGI